jgi:hypothetical protein
MTLREAIQKIRSERRVYKPFAGSLDAILFAFKDDSQFRAHIEEYKDNLFKTGFGRAARLLQAALETAS